MWTKDLFKVEKPVIALLHLRAMPGDPLFGGEDTMESVIQCSCTVRKQATENKR